MADPTATVECIAARESCSVRKINMTISLAFLAVPGARPRQGRHLEHRMGVTRL
jgi:hypothetical protein